LILELIWTSSIPCGQKSAAMPPRSAILAWARRAACGPRPISRAACPPTCSAHHAPACCGAAVAMARAWAARPPRGHGASSRFLCIVSHLLC